MVLLLGTTWISKVTSAQAFRLVPSDVQDHDRFGRALDLDGEFLIAATSRSPYGAVYIYQYGSDETWHEQARLEPSVAIDGDSFGHEVAIDGRDALVAGTESVYHYAGTDMGWTEAARLTAPDDADSFAWSVALQGDLAAIGGGYSGAGAVYLFRRSGMNKWNLEARLMTDPVQGRGLRFGRSVALGDGAVLIGDPDFEVTAPGYSYIFERSESGAWVQVARLAPSIQSGSFGWDVAFSNDVALIGAFNQIENEREQGAAYVFRKGMDGQWHQDSMLTASDADTSNAFGDRFGHVVSLQGDTALVGTAGTSKAYLFSRSVDGRWKEEGIVEAPVSDPEANSLAVALSSGLAAVGVPQADRPVSNAGAVYIYDVSEVLSSSMHRPETRQSATLHSIYPNPFQQGSNIAFSLDRAMPVRVAVYDVLGREVAVLAQEVRSSGLHTTNFNASHLPSGTYFVRLWFDGNSTSRMLTLRR